MIAEAVREPGPARRVAAFDVDGTLTRRDCVVPFLRLVGGPVRAPARFLRRPLHVGGSVVRRQRDTLKAHAAFAAFSGRDHDAVEHLAEGFAQRVHDEWLRPDTLELLRSHQQSGDTVVLVSASFEIYLLPLARMLGVDHVLATRLVVGEDRRLSGGLEGANCRGPEKVRRLHAWCREHAVDRDQVEVTAYGDSTGDRELLLDADRALWMGRSDRPTWFPR